ncbi:Response regulator receiver domain-containing protein [Halovenus aranensis]|uniref:Response regulator receiver domain-containing protein n=1 Tax=Halovenus aranensis TaxID=890420 RepID=A0A1G8XH13_9EURY|nr:response regulator [Halovenus aranensis]SDJ89868.1 Response regulator receiver domain-containing protein [Halovenus aranensis]
MGVTHSRTADTGADICVLHVDDNPDMLSLTATLLEDEDDRITVRSEAEPAAALEAIEQQRVDCVLSDYEMPEMNGPAFFTAVRRVDETVPFVLFTQKASPEMTDIDAEQLDGHVRKRGSTEQYARLAERILEHVKSA